MKGEFSPDQIKQIETKAMHPIYQAALGVIGTKNPFAIMRVSFKGLVFVYGTDDTGFTHIHQRHISKDKEFWVDFLDDKGNVVVKKYRYDIPKKRLDNPSQFHPFSIPIIDFTNIADAVYKNENLNTEKNKRQEEFDLYEGLASGLDGNEILYRLLVYKGSKVVHTLYPLERIFTPRNRVVHFARQIPSSTITVPPFQVHVEIPYKDEYDTVRFIVIVRNDPEHSEVENWFIQANWPNGVPCFTYRFGSRRNSIPMDTSDFLERLEATDLEPLEKTMKSMDRVLIKKFPLKG